MAKTDRRNLLRAAVVGSFSTALGLAMKPETATSVGGTSAAEAQSHDHKPLSGPLAQATVSFGGWQTAPTPLDRFPNNSPIDRNQHQLIPHEVTIQAGGMVNFIIGGFHHVLVYGPRTRPTDINANAQNPAFPLLIDDPRNRVYRGVDPRLFPQDRVETVHFANPGTYLVICGVRPHFVDDEMFGFVKVLRHGDDD